MAGTVPNLTAPEGVGEVSNLLEQALVKRLLLAGFSDGRKSTRSGDAPAQIESPDAALTNPHERKQTSRPKQKLGAEDTSRCRSCRTPDSRW